MKIGDEVYIHGYVDEIRKDTVIIRNEGGYFGTVMDEIKQEPKTDMWSIKDVADALEKHGLLEQEPKTGHCKDCKYFEYDSKIDGLPFIVAHEICSRWGDGCKTKEDGYCFLFEPQESEEQA